jgi:predicted dinucleotide-binding enzyme
MHITIIGTGSIGTALATAWQSAGRNVTLASREPQAATHEGVPLGAIDQALLGADVVLLAIPGSATVAFLREHGDHLASATVIDASNSVGEPTMHHFHEAEGLLYYRAFNTLGVENFRQPKFGTSSADLFFSGPARNREVVESLITDVGLRPIWVGDGAGAADLLDGVTRLWFTLAMQQGRGRHLAFRMLP